MDGIWEVERRDGAAGALHGRPFPSPSARRVTILEVERPALVLGSAQPAASVDAAALATAGVDLVRRRSGGGAVLLEPAGSLWVDVEIPRSDRLWDDDVGRAGHWLGECWRTALAAVGIDATVHTGGLVRSRWSSLVCFAGLGPGEVTTARGKVVGTSQRRTSAGARFQCVVHHRWDPVPLLALLALDGAERSRAGSELADVATGVERSLPRLADALLAALAEVA